MKPFCFLILVGLTSFASWSQESQGDYKLDLYQSQNWNVDGFKIYKLDQKEPHQLLAIGPEMIYLFSHFNSEEKGSSYVFIELENWLELNDSLILKQNFTDQPDHNEAWQTNMIAAKKTLKDSDTHRFSNFRKANRSDKYCWLSDDYSIYYERGDRYLSRQTEQQNQLFKSKLFEDLFIAAQNEDGGLGQHVLINTETNESYLFCPTSKKAKKTDFILQDQQLSTDNQYHFINWSSQEHKDLLELTDSSLVVYQVMNHQITNKQTIYEADSLAYVKEIRNQDMNKDGNPDLILNGEQPFILFNTKDAPEFHSLGLDGCDPEGLSIADVNNDGQPDLLINAHYGLVICYNNNGSFRKNQTIDLGGGITFYFLADLDKDGVKELLLKDYYKLELFQCSFENNLFSQPQPLEMFWD